MGRRRSSSRFHGKGADQPDPPSGKLAEADVPTPKVVYACEALRKSTPEIPGVVQDSPIDLTRFKPTPGPQRGFTIGRVSRDVPEKHHPNDPALYLRLADQGIHIRIMGGTCLGLKHENIELLPEGSMPVEEFLQSLDCFFFRTDPSWFETFGRVNFEALSCGIPVIAERHQGFADRLKHEEDSFLIDTDKEAEAAILSLRDDLDLRLRMSKVARQTAERLFGEKFLHEIRHFYLGS